MTVAAATVLVAAVASAQAPSRIRGTIVSVDATTMVVKSREGRDVTLKLADDLGVAVAKASAFEDLRAGDYVGSATQRMANGDDVALEVHYLAPTVPPGRTDWDLQPGSQMTNAKVVSTQVGASGRQLILDSPAGQHRIVVPEGAPIVKTVPGTRADLVPGEYVFVSACTGTDGVVTALRIQVSKDGVRPPH